MSVFASFEVARRAEGARWILGVTFLALSGAFFKAQVLEHDKFKVEAGSNRLRPIKLPSPRGDILDRNGLPIAENVPGYSIKLLAANEDSLRAVLARLLSYVPADSVNADAVVRRWRVATFQPVQVFASGEDRLVAILEEHRAALPGLVIQAEPRRTYPHGEAVAHLVGYVSEISDAEMKAGTFGDVGMGEIVGKQGLEVEYDSLLRGQQGTRYVEVTARGRTVRDQPNSGSVRPVAGSTMRTTIDLPLQLFIDSMWRADLPEKRGAMVAMTPKGEILAYYSHPGFDPNAFIGGISAEDYAVYHEDSNHPLIDRVINGRYPPASPFKLAIATMALRRGLVTMDSRMPVPCSGGLRFGNRVFKCWKRDGGHGSLTLTEAIKTSCDVYFYQLGQLIGRDGLLEDGQALGFSDMSGIDLEQEKRSIFPRGMKDYINSRGLSTWSNGEVLNLSIGQGRNTQTLINMVSFYAALAGDGIKRPPHIYEPRPGTKTYDLGLKPEQLLGLRHAMAEVVRSGTAGASGGREFDVAGKTGSGQVSNQKDIGWFIGFAPADSAKIVVGIQVEEGEHGALVAKYVVKAIGRFLQGPGSPAIRTEYQLPISEDTTPAADSLAPDTTRAVTRPATPAAKPPARKPGQRR
ncbi:MAG: penicillin-binding protein 2 [Gemmatimonadota bacterium]